MTSWTTLTPHHDRPARDFLRILYRKGRLTAAELDARLRALKDLAAGKLGPALWLSTFFVPGCGCASGANGTSDLA